MATGCRQDEALARAVDAVRCGTCDEARARAIYQLGEEAVIFVLLALALQQAPGPHRPSGMTPVYEKPTSQRRKPKPRGGRPGHQGHCRPTPERIDRHEEHQLPCCPDCGGKLRRTGDTRTRYVEDIPADLQPITTEHTLHRDWCAKCKQRVEPKVADALPQAQLGHRTLVFSAWLHYALGNTLSQIRDVFAHHLQLPLSEGGLCGMWQRLAEVLGPWYEAIHEQALDSARLHGDETGWRVDGQTRWLWCFSNDDLTFYQIDRSRGSPALEKFFTTEFAGTLITDFWAAYNAFEAGDRQKCWAHLLREIKTLNAAHANSGDDWPSFARRVRRLFTDAVKLHAERSQHDEHDYARRVVALESRAAQMSRESWESRDACRLAGRLAKYGHELFTFLWHHDVPPTNNHAERAIRPAVILRKNSYQNASERGAWTQAVLMTVLRTLKQRGHNPLDILPGALANYVTQGQLPPLPKPRSPPAG